MAEETTTEARSENDHDLLIRIDEQLRGFLGVQRDHTNTLADHTKELAEHKLVLQHTITVKGLLTGVASAIGASVGFIQFIDYLGRGR